MDKSSREYEVCVCRHVTRGKIEDYISESGVTDLKEICSALNMGNVCGACREIVEEIITQTASN